MSKFYNFGVIKIYQNDKGQLHRLDGAAIEYADGNKVWYLNDKRHRIDGAAIEYADGNKSWYINGKYISDVNSFFKNLLKDQ